MSGHSHWAGIKHKKGIEDAKRAKVFTKLARVIVVAAREKGWNPDMNPSLRLAIEKARAANMPTDKIERAIERGSGKGGEEALEGFCYEAFGPGSVATLIEGITDNKNRTFGEVRKIITDHGGRMAEQGSVQWMFNRKGLISLSSNDKIQITNKILNPKCNVLVI
jgi:YebC/PmpR family DNA-binding regulatory protein